MLPKEVDLKKCSLFNTLFKINFQMAILLRLADEVEEVLARVNLGGGGGSTVTSSLYVLIVKASQADVHKEQCEDRGAVALNSLNLQHSERGRKQEKIEAELYGQSSFVS